ncbi:MULTISPECIES: hypothetical protein [unclassified Agarivorans]|uniref:hypothetical protein n=1 Tax=unclassified Agarivorans TaxID=2636026 RepID=UPI0026E47446|nr:MULTISPECIES: hypothetical protein [unclassified Agarivorans]MDO6684842.1 hypothetical protein [Agarivorans sp. 3_MG-2023]MDO6714997.1 hypothetical protein [Agarivorans sp. 2_MG-2023]
MKRTVLATLIAISPLALTGCLDNSSTSDDSELQARTVSVKLQSPASIGLKEGEREGNDLHEKVIKVYDNNGYPHFLRVDGYQVLVNDFIDGVGAREVLIDIEDISKADSFDIEVTGEAHIKLIAPITYFDGDVAYSYTAVAEETVTRETNEVLLYAEYDPSFSYVTVRASEDVDRANTYVNDENLAAALNEDGTDAYHTVYIQKESVIEITTTYGSTTVDALAYDPKKPEHYPFNITKTEDGGIIIVPPKFGEPIEISPVEPIITKSQVMFAEITETSITGAVTLVSKPRGGKPKDFEATVKTVVGNENLGTIGDRNLDFTYDLLTHTGNIQPYVNIYVDGTLEVTHDDETITLEQVKSVTYYGNGRETVTVRFESSDVPSKTFDLSEVLHLNVTNQLDNNGRGNFWVRLNDEDANSGTPITIRTYDFSLSSEE